MKDHGWMLESTCGGWFGRTLLAALSIAVSSSTALASAPAQIYVTDRGSTQMYVLDAETLNTIAEIPVAGECGRPAIHPDETRIYVGCWGTNLVYEVSTTTFTVLRAFPLERQPFDIVVTPTVGSCSWPIGSLEASHPSTSSAAA